MQLAIFIAAVLVCYVRPFHAYYYPEINNEAIAFHNNFRRNYANNYYAADMSYMEIDWRLILDAQRWADKCTKNFAPGDFGQILHRERNDRASLKTMFESFGKKSGLVPQVVYSKANRIGCAIANCPGHRNLVCNYNKMNKKGVDLYSHGRPCSQCSGDEIQCYASLCARKGFYKSQMLFNINQARQVVAQHKHTSMRNLVWNDDMANQAQKQVRKCLNVNPWPFFWAAGSKGTDFGAFGTTWTVNVLKHGYNDRYAPLRKDAYAMGCGWANCGSNVNMLCGWLFD